ncbi:MAG: calcium/sodium antiporter [Bacteroidales bacterium]|nr:calcium/sodium antiporter [Bacteroidales bacterium]
MSVFLSILLIVGGLIILVKGADVFVDGSSQIAKKLNVSERIIGLTLVAFGTSFPELSISVIAAINKSDGLAIGNVVGSNILNICGVLGIIALIRPITVSKPMVKKDIPMGILATLVLLILLFDTIFTGDSVNRLTRGDALILLLFFAVFLYYTFYNDSSKFDPSTSLRAQESADVERSRNASVPAKLENYNLTKNIILIILGLGGVLLGGDFVVRGGIKLAETFGMSHTLIGLTIVSIGTSLPEITTGIVAILKGKDDIAIGNVIGSSVLNILFILGTAALITPIILSVNILIDVILMIVVTVFLWFTSRSKGQISKEEGIFFLVVYIIYLIYIIHRG